MLYRDYSDSTRKQEAFEYYIKERFSAKKVMNDENFLVIDWRGSLSGSLASRFIVDKKSGNLIVSGDSGDCIAHWHSSITPKGVEISMNDISCFLDKVEASSKLYSFDADLAEDDFREAIRKRIHEQHDSLLEYLASWTGDTLSEMDGYARREIREDFSWDMAMILDSLIELEGRGDYIPDDVDARMKEWFGEEWQEDFPDILDCGKELASYVYYWAVGYQMAFAQLTEELEKDSRDSEKTYLQRFFEEEAFFRLKEVFNLSEEDVQKHTQHIADVLYANSEACLDAECMDSLIEDALNL